MTRSSGRPGNQKPLIEKLGTIDRGLVETTPVVHRGRLYRFEYVRATYHANETGDSYFRFVDCESGEHSAPFATGYHLGNVFVENDTLYVTGTNAWDGERIDLFASNDMVSWERWNALDLPGYGLFNTSLCRAADRYVLMFEIGRPVELSGPGFTARFATSIDLRTWELTAPECTYSKDRYTAPHALRWHDGFYYDFYLEGVDGGYEQCVVRSPDLIEWTSSPLNPVLAASDDDRIIANEKLTAEDRQHIAAAENCNNSDIDFCEFNGELIINYSWGNQRGIEQLAEAVYRGSEAQFLTSWFPKES